VISVVRLVNAFFGTLATIGLAASVVVHGLSLLGKPLQDAFPAIWGLHVGIFLVFIPAVLELRNTSDRTDPLALMRGVPPWAAALVGFLFIYAFINFFTSFTGAAAGSPEIRDGQYVLMNKGRFVRALTFDEYVQGRANILRGFSGHWMVFYAVAAVVLLLRRPSTRA
jgi:hypothetical protein